MNNLIGEFALDDFDTKLFGKFRATNFEGVRIGFKTSQILIGNFDLDWEIAIEYNLGRINMPGYTIDPDEDLRPQLDFARYPKESEEFAKQYFTNVPFRDQKWPALQDISVISKLSQLSPAVSAVHILQNHRGIVLAYSFERAGGRENFRRDLQLSREAYLAAYALGDTFRNSD